MGNYLDREKGYHPQRGLSINEPERVYLEIIGGKNVFSEKLKQVFDDDTLNIIRIEGIYPDLIGYVQKNPQSPKEIIIAEIKDVPITLKMLGQVKIYKEIFNASFAFLISTEDISEERVRYLLKKPSIKEGVIIAKFIPKLDLKEEDSLINVSYIEINAKFKETVPDFLYGCLRPKETEPKPRPKSSILNKMFKQ